MLLWPQREIARSPVTLGAGGGSSEKGKATGPKQEEITHGPMDLPAGPRWEHTSQHFGHTRQPRSRKMRKKESYLMIIFRAIKLSVNVYSVRAYSGQSASMSIQHVSAEKHMMLFRHQNNKLG